MTWNFNANVSHGDGIMHSEELADLNWESLRDRKHWSVSTRWVVDGNHSYSPVFHYTYNVIARIRRALDVAKLRIDALIGLAKISDARSH